jgi:hypothetical protein
MDLTILLKRGFQIIVVNLNQKKIILSIISLFVNNLQSLYAVVKIKTQHKKNDPSLWDTLGHRRNHIHTTGRMTSHNGTHLGVEEPHTHNRKNNKSQWDTLGRRRNHIHTTGRITSHNGTHLGVEGTTYTQQEE